MQQPTTVSVGPYSLMILVSGAFVRQKSNFSVNNASPPITNVFTFPATSDGGINSANRSRCAGVILIKLKSVSFLSASASESTPLSGAASTTDLPVSNGVNRLVTVKSKETGE